MTIAAGIGVREQANRAAAVRQARASSALEGLTSTEQTRSDQNAYAAGAITLDELIARTQERHSFR